MVHSGLPFSGKPKAEATEIKISQNIMQQIFCIGNFSSMTGKTNPVSTTLPQHAPEIIDKIKLTSRVVVSSIHLTLLFLCKHMRDNDINDEKLRAWPQPPQRVSKPLSALSFVSII